VFVSQGGGFSVGGFLSSFVSHFFFFFVDGFLGFVYGSIFWRNFFF